MPAMSGTETQCTVDGTVKRIVAETTAARSGDYRLRGLELAVHGDADRAFIILPEQLVEYGRSDLYDFPGLCRIDASVRGLNLFLNNRLDDGSVIYSAGPDALLILEPHHPVRVTDAVEAATCLKSAHLRFALAPDEPIWTAKGAMIHELFGYRARCFASGTEATFEEAFRSSLPILLEAVPGSDVSLGRDSLKDEVEQHFMNLGGWFKSLDRERTRLLAEVDVLAPGIGLRGRMDALTDNGSERTILELKTGRWESSDHILQLQAYALMYADGAHDLPVEGVLFYTRTNRLHGVSEGNVHKIILGRNRVTALQRAYAEGPHRVVELINASQCPRNGKCFERKRCNNPLFDYFRADEPPVGDETSLYYHHWFRELSLDIMEEELRFSKVFDPKTLDDRVREGVTLMPDGIELRTVRDGEKTPEGIAHLHFEDGCSELTVGDDVLLHRGDPCAFGLHKARVIGTAHGSAEVRLKPNGFDRSSEELRSETTVESAVRTGWYVDRMPFLRPRELSRQNLSRFLARAGDPVKQAVLCPEASDPGDVVSDVAEAPEPELLYSEGLCEELNEDQEDAVRKSLNSPVFHLIHGPPGTGKTRVLARLVRLCLDRNERVLVVCPTNVALDRILMGLAALGVNDVLRLGSRDAATPEFKAVSKVMNGRWMLLKDLAASCRSITEMRKRADGFRLVAATAYQCAGHAFFNKQRFDRVVVDEAGQLDEPATLATLTPADKFVLCGDHLQLPPIARRRDGDGSVPTPLEISLFERMILSAPPERVSRLRTQYRMNGPIQEIASRLFYDGSLVSSPDVASRRLTLDGRIGRKRRFNSIMDPEKTVVFVDVAGTEKGRTADREASLCARVVEGFLAGGLPADELGVISPYRAQQALIRSYLAESKQARAGTVTIDTVDRFQGGEREVILLSLVRSDTVTSFLADRKRLNVSMSRARSKLVLFGNARILKTHPLFGELLDMVEILTVDETTDDFLSVPDSVG